MMDLETFTIGMGLLFLISWGTVYLIECRVLPKVVLPIAALLFSATLMAAVSLQALLIAMFCAQFIIAVYVAYLLNLRRLDEEILTSSILKDERAIP